MIYISTNELKPLEYEALEWKDNSFSEQAMEKLKAMLGIKKEGNIIYICHPKHLFNFYVEDPETKELRFVDFDDIDIEKMMRYHDYGRYSIVEQTCSKTNNQLTYILKKASHMIKKYASTNHENFSYHFAIVEEMHSEIGDPKYFVRGIISCNQNGFSIAFNPNAIKEIPKESVWQKGLHFGDNYN